MNLHHQAAERGREYEDPHHQTKMTDNSLSATFLNSKASNYVIARQDLNKFFHGASNSAPELEILRTLYRERPQTYLQDHD